MPLRCLALLVFGLATAVGGVRAAAVVVNVQDSTGRPLAHAVVMIEPARGRLPVKPMQAVDIVQAKRQFAPQLTVVTTGTAVNFPNHDTVRHHVYSFSAAKTFELKLYAGVPGTPVVFDKPGVAVLGCNIHDPMVAWVVVADTPHFARSDASGHAQVDGVPAGSYRLRTWHSSWPADKDFPSQALQVGDAPVSALVQLPAGGPP